MAIPITSNISSLSSPNLTKAAKSQISGKTSSVKSTVTSRADELKTQLKLLKNLSSQTKTEYSSKLKKLQTDFQSGYISTEENNIKYNQFQSQLTNELNTINEEIKKVQSDITGLSTDVLKKAKEEKKKLDNTINQNIKFSKTSLRKFNSYRNIKVFPSPPTIIIKLLTNFVVLIANKNSKLQELVDKTNETIESANTIQKINQARVLRNNALKAINDQQQKVNRIRKIVDKIRKIVRIITKVLRIINRILSLPFVPFLLPAKIKIQPILQKILKILEGINIGLNIVVPVLTSIVDYLEYLKSLLKQIGDLIDIKATNPTSNVTLAQLSTFFNELAGEDSNTIRGTTQPVETGGVGVGTGVPQPSSLSPQPTSISGLLPSSNNYKGFRFAIREENNPKFTVRGFKRHYAVAIDEYDVEILKSDFSFTLDPQDLIEQLRLIIDRDDLATGPEKERFVTPRDENDIDIDGEFIGGGNSNVPSTSIGTPSNTVNRTGAGTNSSLQSNEQENEDIGFSGFNDIDSAITEAENIEAEADTAGDENNKTPLTPQRRQYWEIKKRFGNIKEKVRAKIILNRGYE